MTKNGRRGLRGEPEADDKCEEKMTGRKRRIGGMEDWTRLTDERKEGAKMTKDEK